MNGRLPSKDDVLTRYMAERGLKSTRQRSLIIDTFFGSGGHLSVEQLWSKVRLNDARVSVATVYRTMKLLSECGLAEARNFGDGQTRYEASVGKHHHDHLICTRCGQIVESRDHVLSTRFSPMRFSPSIFFSKPTSTYGPFFADRVMQPP